MEEARKSGRLMSMMEKEREKLAGTGLVLNGTVTEVNISRGSSGSKRKYGPYYQWTFKRGGKTVTVNLSASQKSQFRKAINNNRKTERTLERMRCLSREILESSIQGVSRRKKRVK